jgi:AcrR family transcriptional regulator
MHNSSLEEVPTLATGRVRQKARTRRALLDAATQLIRDGKPPSMPDVAEAALVSPATAYRYFPSAQALWQEASLELVEPWTTDLVDNAGDDPAARLDAVVKTIGWHMLDEEVLYRGLVRAALERWFDQAALPEPDRTPVREARRPRWNAKVVEPLRTTFPAPFVDELMSALSLVWGTEALITLRDVARLDTDDAKQVMLHASRWMLQGALADATSRPGSATDSPRQSSRRTRRSTAAR